MQPEKILMEQFMRIVEEHITSDVPPEVNMTFNRLTSMGYSERETKLLIAQCVAADIMHAMDTNQPQTSEYYIACLKQLPESPK
jgi:hypothetical protein